MSSIKNSDLYASGDIKMQILLTRFHDDPKSCMGDTKFQLSEL